MEATEKLTGEIRVGDKFVWEPANPRAFARVTVTGLRHNAWDQLQVQLEIDGLPPGNGAAPAAIQQRYDRDFRERPGVRCWNDEDRVREACVRADDYDAGLTRVVGREAPSRDSGITPAPAA